MEALFPFVFLFGGPILVILVMFSGHRAKEAKQAWQAAASSLGISFVDGGMFGTKNKLLGHVEGFDVEVWVFSRGSGKSRTTYTGFRTMGIPTTMKLGSEGFWSSMGRALGITDVEVGETMFDEAIKVSGQPGEVRALLDHPTREFVYRAVKSYGVSVDRAVYCEARGTVTDTGRIIDIVETQVKLAQALSQDPSRERLLQNAMGADVDQVRINCLSHLVRTQKGWPELIEACAQLLHDEKDSLHVRAAALKALHELDATIDDLSTLSSEPTPLGPVAIEAMLDRGDRPTREQTAALLAGSGAEVVLGCRAARHLGGFEEEMIARLSDDLSPHALTALATVLGQVGSTRAVEALMPLTKGLLTDGAVKDAARTAIAAIQERAGGNRGGLAMAEETGEGKLSVAQGTGQLSNLADGE